MSKTITFTLALLLCAFSKLFATNVTIHVAEAGTLSTALTNAGHTLSNITELTITGEIDTRDFVTIRGNIKSLTSLDISEAQINAYSGPDGSYMMAVEYPANTVPDWAFYHIMLAAENKTLVSVKLGQAAIGYQAFYNCTALTSIDFGSHISSIGEQAFAQCTGLTEITIPNTVNAIAKNAFAKCSKLESFEFQSGASITTLNEGVIPYAKIETLTLPASLTTIVSGALIYYHGSISVEDGSSSFSSYDGILYNKDKTHLIAATGAKGSLVLPETVVSIGERAFYNNVGLTSISLPNALQTIGTDAFYRNDTTNSSLEEIIIDPQLSQLTTIEKRGLANLKKLTKLIIPKNVTTLEDTACGNNSGLEHIYSYIEAPFVINSYVFTGVDKTNCKLIVPAGTVELYKATEAWNAFQNIEELSFDQLFLTDYYKQGSFFVYELSSNGKYAAGSAAYGAYRWDITNSTESSFDITYLNSDGVEYSETISEAVNDEGMVIGNYEQQYNGATVYGPGIWENGVWTSLLIETSYFQLPTVVGMSNDGQTVVGNYMPTYTEVEPYSWKKVAGTWTKETWSYPAGGQGARIYGYSPNSTIACGWSVNETTNGNRVPIYWTSPSVYKIIGNEYGEARKVSDNGKYIAMTYASNAALYKIETDEIIIIKANASAMDVSDNGIVVGYYNLPGDIRKGFIWTEEHGFADLYDILAYYLPDSNTADFKPSNATADVISSISANGKVLGGYKFLTNVLGVGWVFTLKEDYNPLKNPTNLTANPILAERNKVLIEWNAPANESNKTLTGYVLYRNQQEVTTLAPTLTQYTDDLSSTEWTNGGNVSYALMAIYDNTLNSPRTQEVSVLIYDNYDIPYVDDFEYLELSENYWTVERTFSSNFWFINPTYANGYRGTSMTFSTFVSGNAYNESIISKPFDARSENEIYLSYLYSVEVLKEISDKVYVEIQKTSENNEWLTVAQHTIVRSAWQFNEIDLSDKVAGTIFKVRFRAAGTDGSQYYFEIDNLQVRTTSNSAAAPLKPLAKINSDNTISLTWQNPSGAYALSYCISDPWQAIGNQGVSFIAANKFETKDLSIYEGDHYLTSISGYVTDDAGYGSETALSLAVFENDTRICSQAITSFELEAWNTFVLNTPIKIDPAKTLYIGIEVVNHNTAEKPLATDQSQSTYDGKGNLFSEDGGKTWQKLSSFGLTRNWCIIGNVRNESSGTENDRNYTIWGYRVFRGEQLLNEELMLFPQTYIDDVNGVNAIEVCYTIQAYYADKAWSARSEKICSPTTVNIEDILSADALSVYPNPVEDYLNIEGLAENAEASIYDLSGRLMLSQNIHPSKGLAVQNLQAGMYILRISIGNKTHEIRIIKK